MQHPDSFRSAMYRSLKKTLLAGCQDPRDHVEPDAVRRYARPPPPPSTAMVSVGCGGLHRAAHRHPSGPEDEAGSIRRGGGRISSSTTTTTINEAQLSRVSAEAEQLQRVVGLWARQQQQLYPRSMDVAEGLLRGALELQDSLALLREMQEASRSRKRRSRREAAKYGLYPSSTPAAATAAAAPDAASGMRFDARNYQRIYDNPWHSARSAAPGSKREDFRKLAIDGFQRQCLPAASSSEENTYFTQSLRFTSSSGSVASCSHLRSKSDSSDGSSPSCQKPSSRPPNLIVKLMGLEDAPGEGSQPVDKQVVSSSYFEAKMPKVRKSQRTDWKQDYSDGKTFQEMIDTLRIRALPKGGEKAVRRASMDDSIFLDGERPPIVVIKPMLRSFDEEIMRKDVHVDNGSSKKKEDVEATKVVDKEIVLDQNKKTLVKMLEGKEKRDDKAAKMEPTNKTKLPPRTKLPTTVTQKASTKPTKTKNHETLAQMPAVTTPSRRKVEEIKNIRKPVAPPAEMRRARSVPIKVQKQPCSSASQAVQKTSTSSQNRDSSVSPTIQKRRLRLRSDRELKPQAELRMVSDQNNSELDNRDPDSLGSANPSSNGLGPACCLPETEKQECRILREDGREKDSNSVHELMAISTEDVICPLISQEESNIVNHPNSLEKPECLCFHDAEHPATSQEDGKTMNDRVTFISEADANKEIKLLHLSSPSSVKNADETFDPDEAQSTDLLIIPQDAEMRNSKLLLDCCIELLQCRNYHVKLSNLAMLRRHAQNTYSLFSQDQLDEEIREKVHNFKSYNEPAADTASLGGLYWRLQMDLNCNGLMGIGGWDCGWIDGISVEEVEQIVSSIEECIACKLIEEITHELVYSPL